MCGLTGFLNYGALYNKDQLVNIVKGMSDVLVHRGPDASGVWCDERSGVALAHRRLSIVDLSTAGHQPMLSSSGRYVLVFNGEIYNHLKLRKDMPNVSWKGSSDTETLLVCIESYGLEKTLKRIQGMFALALWDREEQTLYLTRDRMGEKPLYYGWQGNIFFFGSELKSFKQHPDFNAVINRNAITLLLRHNYIPAPYSIYQGINKLELGCLLEVSSGNKMPKIRSYWSVIDASKKGLNNTFTGSPNDAVNALEALLVDSVSQQMAADVPLGALLSGGIDSSLIVAIMQSQSKKPIKTFSIGFHEKEYDEALYAKAVAKQLDTEHTELYVTPEEVMDVIPRIPELYCEPFSDSSQIPTFLVSQLAKQHVTVSLSGDAGDELFCGYTRYQMTSKSWQKLTMVPRSLRVLIAQGITSLPPQGWDKISSFLPGKSKFNHFGDKLHKGAGVLSSKTVDELYLGLVSHHRDPASLVIGGIEPATLLNGNTPNLTGLCDIQRMMLLDQMTYLTDDILTKVDRAAMGVSLETRMPFLDHRVVEFAWTLPQSIKLRNDESKWPLRQLLYKYVPKELIDRPKMGFGIPLHKWLRGPLRNWAEDLLNEQRLHQEGFFEPVAIRKIWLEHLSGKRNWAYLLWNVLMFQAWLSHQ